MPRARDARGGIRLDRQYGGQITNVGGDQFISYEVDATGLRRFDELSGVGRLVVLVGTLVGMAGFAMFCYPIFATILALFSAFGQPDWRPDMTVFVPWLPLGFGCFVGGAVVSGLGGMFGRRRRQ